MRFSRLGLVRAVPLLRNGDRQMRSVRLAASALEPAYNHGGQWLQRRGRAAMPLDGHLDGSKAGSITPPPPRLSEQGKPSAASSATGLSKDKTSPEEEEKAAATFCPRNPVGVQLLSRSLQRQLFPPRYTKVPPTHDEALSLSQHHLKSHGLEPEQASTLPPIAFDLPPLQGNDLSQHFWNLGRQAAQPWLGMAHSLAATPVMETLPQGITMDRENDTHNDTSQEDGSFAPRDWLAMDPAIRSECQLRVPKWLKVPGWVRYPVLTANDGTRALGSGVPVDYPSEEDGALVFDVETMVQESHFPVMATAAGQKAWYAWISPWFLQQGERHDEKDHLIPFGPGDGSHAKAARLLIGHNVGYDRARIRDEYSLARSNIRFLDTMSLHVATRGISSPQRGAWVKHNKSKALEKMLEQEDLEEEKKSIIRSILGGEEIDEDILASLDLDEVVAEAQGKQAVPSIPADVDSGGGSASASLLWQDITSNNGLADVAKLHCNIDLPKDTRNFFVDGTSREELVDMLDDLLTYCATDVLVTHKVFSKVWPGFVKNCPNPATTAGVLGLSSAILPVDSEWADYIQRCEDNYESSLQQVRANLVDLAEQQRIRGTDGISWDQALAASVARRGSLDVSPDNEFMEKLQQRDLELQREKLSWESDPWASQLDWTPKKPKKKRVGHLNSESPENSTVPTVPRWYRDKVLKSAAGLGPTMALTPAVLRLRHKTKPFVMGEDGTWIAQGKNEKDSITVKGTPLKQTFLRKGDGLKLQSALGPAGEAVLAAIRGGEGDEAIRAALRTAADTLVAWAASNSEAIGKDDQLQLLDWKPVEEPVIDESSDTDADVASGKQQEWWPKWYWDLYKSAVGELEVTIRSKVAPLLLRLTWQRCPLHHSREHGWVFRYDPRSDHPLLTRQKPLLFEHPADQAFRNDIERTVSERLAELATHATGKDGAAIEPSSITPVYYKVPHAAGDGSNVGSPFSKGFVPFFEKGVLQSEHPEEKGRQAAKSALETNARCSYWIGVRDRVQKQMVVWDGEGDSQMHISPGISGARQDDEAEKYRRKGLILPQIIPMGTVTRRAIEKTWLTASNAKPNRVGSELKAMVKAPPGWCIVGADVDSQELWICSVMGDAQFGFHGATAVGWMTLEGTKSMGTDLHSKTAKILGTSRNQAKVFNYSRIYGAGIRHSSQLLLKATPDMSSDEATQKAKELYASTKGKNTYTDEYFGRRFWYGGTESFVFNKLEEIALGEQPKTPALDCGVTAALRRKYLPKQSHQRQRFGGRVPGSEDYMPSRINWVVQSSGVDYLHLLITAMEHLITTYSLQARFMISVHDEVRYLAKDEDVHRVALALQIANLWTRAMFAHKLQMDSLPQGVGFFAQVDIDKVLRKETDDACLTPSQPSAIPFGQAVDIYGTLEKTHGGSLFRDGQPMQGRSASDIAKHRAADLAMALVPPGDKVDVSLPKYKASSQKHRSIGERGLRFLQAQASTDIGEITVLEERMQRHEKRNYPDHHDDYSFMHEIEQAGRHRAGSKAVAGLGGTAHLRPKAERKVSGSNTASIHTSARTHAPPPAISSIVDQFPPRPMKLHVPFFKTREHRFKMLWQVYAALLRNCPKHLSHVRGMICGVTRAKRHCTSPKQTSELYERAMSLLAQFQQADNGDQEASRALLAYDSDIGRKQHERHWNEQAGKFLKAQKPKPVPRATGALLAPSLFNPPLLRYKPVQPDHITMMIANRRRARIFRQEQTADVNEQIRHLAGEFREAKRMGASTLGGSAAEWINPLQHHERQRLAESFSREERRAGMVFTARMLRSAKHARRDRRRAAIRRKRFEQEAREQQAQIAEATAKKVE